MNETNLELEFEQKHATGRGVSRPMREVFEMSTMGRSSGLRDRIYNARMMARQIGVKAENHQSGHSNRTFWDLYFFIQQAMKEQDYSAKKIAKLLGKSAASVHIINMIGNNLPKYVINDIELNKPGRHRYMSMAHARQLVSAAQELDSKQFKSFYKFYKENIPASVNAKSFINSNIDNFKMNTGLSS